MVRTLRVEYASMIYHVIGRLPRLEWGEGDLEMRRNGGPFKVVLDLQLRA